MSGSSFTNVFGGVALRPAQPSYLALTISVDTALVWPLETTEGQPVLATQMDITASTSGLDLMMPPGNTGSTGVQSIIANVGSDTFTVTDQAGNAITSIATTEAWLIVLTDNTTTNGTWRALQVASTVSQAVAAALAGAGLQANGSQLQINWPSTVVNSSGSVGAGARGTVLKWTGGGGTLQLAASSTLGNGWICAFNNAGTGELTFSCTGPDGINGQSTLVVFPLSSGFIICTGNNGATSFFSIGANLGILPIFAGGTGAGNATGALQNFGGTPTGISIFTAPSTAAVVALLGLSGVNITEATVNTDQTLSPGSGNTAFVCTAALSLDLPLTTSLTDQFSFVAYAQNGNVTFVPQASDAINGGSAGANLVIPRGASAFMFTDANGNWWPALMGIALGGTIDGNVIIANGGLNVNAGGVSVAGGITISSDGIGVTGGGDFDELSVTAPGTAGSEVVNFSQFPATLAVVGTQTLPSGRIEQWGTSATVNGVGTISFASPFPNACLNVDIDITGASGAASLHPLAQGALAAAGVPVYGDSGESLSFSYRAIGY